MLCVDFINRISDTKRNLLHFILDTKHDGHAVDANTFYWECEQKCHQLMKRFFYYVCVQLLTFTPVLIFVLWDMVQNDFDGNKLNLPFNAIGPFNMDSKLGWLLTYFYQLSECASYTIGMVILSSYFMCCSYYIIAMCNHFHLLIESARFLSQEIQAEKIARNRQRMWLNVKAKLQRVIEMHVDIYE